MEQEALVNKLELSKLEETAFLDNYLLTFDEKEAIQQVFIIKTGKPIDSNIAAMLGRRMIFDKKMNKRINDYILKHITSDNIQIDAYKLSRSDIDGRVKIKALELLARVKGMLQETNINNFNLNLPWAQIIEQAARAKRIDNAKAVEGEIVNAGSDNRLRAGAEVAGSV